MDRTTLKQLRVLIPGLILVLEFIPMLNIIGIKYEIDNGWLSYAFLTIAALVIGTFYHISDIRLFITKSSLKKIDLNINEALVKIYAKPLSQEQRNFLKEKRRLKNIFYHLIDNDQSLTAKSQLIYFNGLLWTSTADLFLLSLFSSIIYMGLGVITSETKAWFFCIAFAATAFIAYLFHILTVHKHINLANEQIEFIETHHLKTVETKIDEVLQQLS
jgi:hypothetical protein